MLVLPRGLLDGERLAKCSDEAQLHFPRLAALTNGFGRIELNLRSILDEAYRGFRNAPTRDELAAWLREYANAHLLFLYQAEDGTPWGQWRGIPDNMLPRFKTAADKRSPEPPADDLARFDEDYAKAKKATGDFLNLSEDFGTLPKCSTSSRIVPNISADEVVDEAFDEVVDEGKQKPILPPAEKAKRNRYSVDSERVWKAYPNKSDKAEGLRRIEEALKERSADELVAQLQAWQDDRKRKEAQGEFVPPLPLAATYFHKRRYLDEYEPPKKAHVFSGFDDPEYLALRAQQEASL